MPPCPRVLRGDARLEWRLQAPRLFRMGVLTEVDGSVLTMYCQCWGRWLEAEAAVQRTLDARGRLDRFKVLVASRYLQQVRQLAGELGLSPASRSRISIAERDDDDDMDGVLS